MKRYVPYFACVLGIVLLALLLPRFNVTQPRGIRLTRGDAIAAADAQARRLGIPVDRAWSTLVWDSSRLLGKELEADPDRRRKANDDPVLGPRLGSYRRMHYRRGIEKSTPYGYLWVSPRTGQILGARIRHLNEEAGAHTTEAALRTRADAFVKSREFPGAPSPQFESARPMVLRTRTDWTFRYRVRTNFPIGNVVPYLYVYYAGDQFAGWELAEEYASGSPFRDDTGEGIAWLLVQFATIYSTLLILLIIFLRKYHAGEVGVSTASWLFALTVIVRLIEDVICGPSMGEGLGMGSLDAMRTAAAQAAFKFVLLDVPIAVVVFLGWSVGESYARERWGERLASFDALLRRDAVNATVGRSVLNGILTAPAVTAAAFLVALIPLLLGTAHTTLSIASEAILYLGGPVLIPLMALGDAILFPVTGILFILAFSYRKNALPIGIIVAIALGTIGGVVEPPIGPTLQQMAFGFGGIAACIAIFLAYDLLTTAIALFGASTLLTLPLLSVAHGNVFARTAFTVTLPLLVMLVFAAVALLTRREVAYRHEDLAPHVKRIVERERVKAEIDAANRIQAALLPVRAPHLAGVSVASHYRAATEIGGDYFDFLPQPNGEVGIAFGDVSGHGLTSGIVMAMAKSALMVQVNVDSSPRTVLNVLNEIVIKTAPRRILMTFFFGLLDPATQRLRFSSAGHLDPYAYRARTQKLESLSSWGFPLGVRRRDPFREHVVNFAPGDRLILYSDGLIEALDDQGEPFGFDRFERVLLDACHLSAEDIKKTLLGSIRKFTRNRPPEDDQTLVVVSFDGAVAREEEVEAAYATAT